MYISYIIYHIDEYEYMETDWRRNECPHVANNYLYKSSIQANGKCSGVSLVCHGEVNGMVIENNFIEEDPGLVDGSTYLPYQPIFLSSCICLSLFLYLCI